MKAKDEDSFRVLRLTTLSTRLHMVQVFMMMMMMMIMMITMIVTTIILLRRKVVNSEGLRLSLAKFFLSFRETSAEVYNR